MRPWITLIENLRQYSSDDVIEYVGDLNDREDPYEGEVPERIAQYPTYILSSFPVSQLRLDGYQYDPGLADEYAAMEVATMPPIVVEPNGEIIDGFHRAQGAVVRGDELISAYVGQRPVHNSA